MQYNSNDNSNDTTIPHVSLDGGETWEPARNAEGVLVIGPGIGTRINRVAFDHFFSKLKEQGVSSWAAHLDVNDGGDFVYPDGWENIMSVDLPRGPENSLRGLARKIGLDMISNIRRGLPVPRVIMAGSRGGQVVLPLLLRFFWRGPFVAVNAGPMTSNAVLPAPCVPFFITTKYDYFPTRDPDYVKQQFEKLSDVTGYNLFLHEHHHMPDLNNVHMYELLLNIYYLLMGMRSRPLLETEPHNLYVLHPARRKLLLTVESHNRDVDFVLLRQSATSKQLFFDDNRHVRNGDKVEILDSRVVDNYMMFQIRTRNGLLGWMYERNFQELQ